MGFRSMVLRLVYHYLSSYWPNAFGDTKIDGIVTAIYFSIVTMATVGYGDITPRICNPRACLHRDFLRGWLSRFLLLNSCGYRP